MRAICNHFYTRGMGSICNFSNRHDLATPVDQVGHHHNLCLGGKGFGIAISNFILIFHGKLQVYPDQFDAITLFPLLPCIDHVGIILPCEDNFISRFEIEAK